MMQVRTCRRVDVTNNDVRRYVVCRRSFEHGLSGFAASEKEEATAAHRIRSGAREIRGGGDSAEEDKPIPEGTEDVLWFTH